MSFLTTTRARAIFAIALILGVLWYWQPWTSEEAIIHQRLDELLAEIEIRTAEHPLEKVAKSRKISMWFEDPLKVEFALDEEEGQVFKNRKEIEQAVLTVKTQLSALEVALVERKVVVTGDRAVVTGDGKVLGAMPGAEGQFLEQPEVELRLRKSDRVWKIESGSVRQKQR